MSFPLINLFDLVLIYSRFLLDLIALHLYRSIGAANQQSVISLPLAAAPSPVISLVRKSGRILSTTVPSHWSMVGPTWSRAILIRLEALDVLESHVDL